jgi:hypothetical protein
MYHNEHLENSRPSRLTRLDVVIMRLRGQTANKRLHVSDVSRPNLKSK